MMFEAWPATATARYETVVHGDINLEITPSPAWQSRCETIWGGSNVLTREEAASLVEDGVHDGVLTPIQGVNRVFTPQQISRCIHCGDIQTGAADFEGLVAVKRKSS